MEAALTPTLSLLQLKFRKCRSFLGDNPHMPTVIAFRASFLPTALSVISDGKRRGPSQRKTAGRSPLEDKGGTNGESSNQKELISMFKKIQTSISRAQSKTTKARRMPKPSKDGSSIESVLEVFQQPNRKTKGKALRREKERAYSPNRRIPKKADEKLNDQPADTKLTRPPSSFVKRSPIPSPTPARSTSPEPTVARGTRSGLFEESMQTGELKLADLKEFAKTRGIKGYSKLKKKELVELLSSPGNA